MMQIGKSSYITISVLTKTYNIIDCLLIGSLFMSRIVKFFNFSYSLLDLIEDEMKLLVTVNKENN